MKHTLLLTLLALTLSGCLTVPTKSPGYHSKCEISTDRLTLRIVDIADKTDSYYSISGIILSPILIPTSALISGTYVLANNIYNLGEEKIRCSKN